MKFTVINTPKIRRRSKLEEQYADVMEAVKVLQMGKSLKIKLAEDEKEGTVRGAITTVAKRLGIKVSTNKLDDAVIVTREYGEKPVKTAKENADDADKPQA